MDVVVIDGYVDEPAALGVRPFLHPVVRAMYGAALDAGARVTYLSIDHIRKGIEIPRAHVYAFHMGTAVPGRYLRSMPASEKELNSILNGIAGQAMVGGPAALNYEMGDDVILARRDAAAALHDLLLGGEITDRWRTLNEWNRWLLLGASVVRQHPDFPEPLIVEVETYRGCMRYDSGGCSFCVEPLKGKPVSRDVDDIVNEAARLRELGVTNFRLGGQTCFVSYLASRSRGEIVPNPEAVDSLLSRIASLKPRVLHLDNANPAVIATRPEESREVLRSVVRHCSSGNVLAFGMESADPSVIEANNLNATPEQVMFAIAMMNELGGERGENGLPRLLPGLNFIIGLDGECAKTLDLNLDFLKDVLKRGHLLRRINIRQVMCIRRGFRPGVKRSQFIRFKEKVRDEVDRPILERLVPVGTVLKDVYIEKREGNRSFGRQVGTYPILVGFEYPLATEGFLDAAVVGWGYRSITAVEHPLSVNSCPMSALNSLPGIGKKRTARLVRARPLKGKEDLMLALGDKRLVEELEGMLSFRFDSGEA
jgi:radical SAM superfamily enzyme with C-terminal helix-hairpin-helix motif